MFLVRLLEVLFKIDIRNRFSGYFSLIFDIIISLISLSIYWYTSRIFDGAVNSTLEKYGQNYFSFIVWGELFLILPMYFVDSFVQGMRSSFYDGVYESFSTMPIKWKGKHWISGFLNFPRELLRILIQFLLAYLLFNLNFNFMGGMQASLVVILLLPAFLGLGYFFLSVFIYTGRGTAIIGLVNTLFAFLAGAYFPINFLPKTLVDITSYISPFTLVLENARLALVGHQEISLMFIFMAICLSSFYLFLGLLSYKFALRKIKMSGRSWTNFS